MNKTIMFGICMLVLLAGCVCEGNGVIHSGKVETVYSRSIAIDGKLIERVCVYSLEDISEGDYVNVYCQSNKWGCDYVVSKITTIT